MFKIGDEVIIVKHFTLNGRIGKITGIHHYGEQGPRWIVTFSGDDEYILYEYRLEHYVKRTTQKDVCYKIQQMQKRQKWQPQV